MTTRESWETLIEGHLMEELIYRVNYAKMKPTPSTKKIKALVTEFLDDYEIPDVPSDENEEDEVLEGIVSEVLEWCREEKDVDWLNDDRRTFTEW